MTVDALVATIGTSVTAAKTLTEVGVVLYEVIERARQERVEKRAVLYLGVAQRAIRVLGKERQGILSDAAGCDVEDRAAVEALERRMRIYLQEDNVRPRLTDAIEGLQACRAPIERSAERIRWRKRDRQQGVQTFLSALDVVTAEMYGLVHMFYPEFSGQGLGTLVPVYRKVVEIRDEHRAGGVSDIAATEEELAGLVRDALRDPAQDEWVAVTGRLERQITEVELAFSVKGDANEPKRR